MSRNPVFPDTNVLLAYVIGYEDPTKVVCLAFEKAKEKDVIVVTNQVLAELFSRAKRDKKASTDRIVSALRVLKPKLIFVKKPSPDELKNVFISDPDDMEILYSARVAQATVILTRDDTWYRDDVFGLDAEITDSHGYLYYERILDGTKRFENSKIGRIVRILKDRTRERDHE